MRTLVTGGSGFVGAYTVRALRAAGHDVVVYDAHARGNVAERLLTPAELNSVHTELGSVSDGWRLMDVCRARRVEMIVHLASPLTHDVATSPWAGLRDICSGTQTVLEVARACHVRRVVWTSSVAVYGPASMYGSRAVTDDDVHRPGSLYGACKSLVERLTAHSHESHGLEVTGLRLTVVYGAGRLRGFMSGPSHLIRDAAYGRPVLIPHGDQPLNWQYVEEVADMLCRALERPGQGRTYNTYGDLRPYRHAAAILRELDPSINVEMGDGTDPTLDDVAFDYDSDGFAREFEYRPSWPLERGVEASYRTYRSLHAQPSPSIVEAVA